MIDITVPRNLAHPESRADAVGYGPRVCGLYGREDRARRLRGRIRAQSHRHPPGKHGRIVFTWFSLLFISFFFMLGGNIFIYLHICAHARVFAESK